MGYVKGGLVNKGYADWTHVVVRLQEYEVGLEHKKNWATCSVVIEKSFLGFINVNDTTGQELFDVLLQELKSLDLDVDNVQGEARDFFGVIQRIYTIFAHSTKSWQILKDNVKGLTLKSISSTRWESRVNSVRAIRFQIVDIREALLQVSKNDYDSKIKSEAKSLAKNELGDFEFLVAIVIWYDMLNYVNSVSKSVQSIDMLIDVAIDIIKGLISFFERYRDVGFSSAVKEAKKIAIELDINLLLPHRRQIRRKKYFNENSHDEPAVVELQSTEDAFRINYFLCMVDRAISSLNRRFEQYEDYEKIFGFLFTSTKLNELDDVCLKSSCDALEVALKNSDCNDVDANELRDIMDWRC
uniref:Uncharacterized protein n=1 Tax=Kalanchoe fedtschenkoi TaxID=63787 RepID=A0A7N0U3J8_KALFE